MPRTPLYKKRKPTKYPAYNEIIIAYANRIMRDGKKSVAIKLIENALHLVTQQFVKENRTAEAVFQDTLKEKQELLGLAEGESLPQEKIGLVVLYRATDNARPRVELLSNRIGGDTRQTIRVVPPHKGERRAHLFLRKAAFARSGISFKPGDKGKAKLLAMEWIDAYDNKGGAIKMCADILKAAKSNLVNSYSPVAGGQGSLPL